MTAPEMTSEMKEKTREQALISVVVLCHDRPNELRSALESIAQQSYPRLEVIVVNNRSARSDEIARVVELFPSFRTIWLSDNIGFAGGMNRGIAAASGEFVYLTEDDLTLDRDCIDRLFEHARRAPEAALLSPVMFDAATGRIRSAGGGVLLDAVHRRVDFGAGSLASWLPSQPYPVSFVPGAMMWARRETWTRLGGFREPFFMYYEDVELCLRLLIDDRQIHVVPAAHVFDIDPGLDRVATPNVQFHKLKNFFSVYLLFAPRAVIPEMLFRYAILGFVRAARSGSAGSTARAILWSAMHLPGFLRERLTFSNAKIRALNTKLRQLAIPPLTDGASGLADSGARD